MKRVFLIVLDALGIGELADAEEYGDAGSNTLRSCAQSGAFSLPHLGGLGLFSIDGVKGVVPGEPPALLPGCAYARLLERSRGKDTTVGHWELMGELSEKPFPTYPKGFPPEVINAFKAAVKRDILCNLPYSGTKALQDYGEAHLRSGALIVYTSADSVFQIAAHEEIVPLEELYGICRKARELLTGEHAVARVIARPFAGEPGNFRRTAGRRDYSLKPKGETALDLLEKAGLATVGIGKIYDIFAGKGISRRIKTAGNAQGIAETIKWMGEDFRGLCFVNLVDTDMLYGHRNDVDGFAAALTEFDRAIPQMLERLGEEDLLMIAGDHGCDPGTPSTDHSREAVPLLLYGKGLEGAVNLGTRGGFAHAGGTVLEALGLKSPFPSLWKELKLKEERL